MQQPQSSRLLPSALIAMVIITVARGQAADYDSHSDVLLQQRSQDWRNASVPRASNANISAWVEAARQIIAKIDCETTSANGIGGRKSECLLMKSRPFSSMNLYVAESNTKYRLETVLIDKYFKSNNAIHDAVIVIDPFPLGKVGHIVLVFFVDQKRNERFCSSIPKAVRSSDGACVHQALRPKCRNVGRLGVGLSNCEITILPLVIAHYTDHLRLQFERMGRFPVGQFQQLLKCRSDVLGFSKCPHDDAATLAFRQSISNISESLKKCDFNVGRCAGISEIRSCKPFEICDQAVLIGGGWNVDTVRYEQYQDLVAMRDFLVANGYAKENVHAFFGPGGAVSPVTTELRRFQRLSSWRIQPAARKRALRSHLHNLCERQYCADALFIYLNAPTLSDGTMLLWDDGDGKVEEDEQYTKEEFFSDIADCTANTVYIAIDQRYETLYGEQFQRSGEQRKAILLIDTADTIEKNRTFTSRFLESLKSQPARCITDNMYAVTSSDEDVTPIYQNIFGAPCSEETTNANSYKRCQPIPANYWAAVGVGELQDGLLNADDFSL